MYALYFFKQIVTVLISFVNTVSNGKLKFEKADYLKKYLVNVTKTSNSLRAGFITQRKRVKKLKKSYRVTRRVIHNEVTYLDRFCMHLTARNKHKLNNLTVSKQRRDSARSLCY